MSLCTGSGLGIPKYDATYANELILVIVATSFDKTLLINRPTKSSTYFPAIERSVSLATCGGQGVPNKHET